MNQTNDSGRSGSTAQPQLLDPSQYFQLPMMYSMPMMPQMMAHMSQTAQTPSPFGTAFGMPYYPPWAAIGIAGLEAESELQGLQKRERDGEALGEAIRDAKKRRDELWQQVKRTWVKDVAEPEEPVEGDGSPLSELDEQSEADEEPTRKRTRLRANGDGRSRSETPTAELSEGSGPTLEPRPHPTHFSIQQKNLIRALICAHLGDRSPPMEEVEDVAEAAGLSVDRVLKWIKDLYMAHPRPTVEQVMSWRTKRNFSDASGVLRAWLEANRDEPYPTEAELERMATETGRSIRQLSDWFANARRSSGLSRTINRRFIEQQVAILTKAFDENMYPGAEELERLARETESTPDRLFMWFRDRRKRQRLSKPKRLPAEQVAPLRAWLHAHMNDPYPSLDKRDELAEETGLMPKQVSDWFSNVRRKKSRGRCPCCGKTKAALTKAGLRSASVPLPREPLPAPVAPLPNTRAPLPAPVAPTPQTPTPQTPTPQTPAPNTRAPVPQPMQPLPGPETPKPSRRSRGCWTCRCRRKRCDETQPRCELCTKLNLPCYGYGKERPEHMDTPEKFEAVRHRLSGLTRGRRSSVLNGEPQARPEAQGAQSLPAA